MPTLQAIGWQGIGHFMSIRLSDEEEGFGSLEKKALLSQQPSVYHAVLLHPTRPKTLLSLLLHIRAQCLASIHSYEEDFTSTQPAIIVVLQHGGPSIQGLYSSDT